MPACIAFANLPAFERTIRGQAGLWRSKAGKAVCLLCEI
jgi:hypothetical protein